MESTRKCDRSKFRVRLLIFLLCLFTTITAFTQDFTNLEFSQAYEFFEGEPGSLFVIIPNIAPSRIEYTFPKFPDTVSLIGLEKISYSSQRYKGKFVKSTKLQIALKFLQSGTYNFEPIKITIDNTDEYDIKFSQITVIPNLLELKPELMFTPSKTLHALQSTEFILSALYFKDIVDYSVELSENALIEETENLFTEANKKDFTANAIPIAKFTCIPFAEGSLILKNVTATFVGYDGKNHEVILKNIELPVLKATNYIENFISFGQQQLLSVQSKSSSQNYAIEDKNTEKAKLIHNEWVAKKKARVPIIIGSFCFSSFIILVSLGMLLFAIKTKKSLQKSIVLLVFGVILILVSHFFAFKEKDIYAITYTTNMYGIPEFDGQILKTLESGTRVKIENDMGDWALIQQENSTSGWVQKQDCLLIQ